MAPEVGLHDERQARQSHFLAVCVLVVAGAATVGLAGIAHAGRIRNYGCTDLAAAASVRFFVDLNSNKLISCVCECFSVHGGGGIHFAAECVASELLWALTSHYNTSAVAKSLRIEQRLP